MHIIYVIVWREIYNIKITGGEKVPGACIIFFFAKIQKVHIFVKYTPQYFYFYLRIVQNQPLLLLLPLLVSIVFQFKITIKATNKTNNDNENTQILN